MLCVVVFYAAHFETVVQFMIVKNIIEASNKNWK